MEVYITSGLRIDISQRVSPTGVNCVWEVILAERA